MRVLVATEQHFAHGEDGGVYVNGPAGHTFWTRYLQVFDEVGVLARVAGAGPVPARARPAGGPGVSFFPLPDYHGPGGYLRCLPELRRRVREAVGQCHAYILRVPGLIGRLAWKEVRRLRRPYALEVVGDPWDALGPGPWASPFRPVYRRVGTAHLRAMCREAAAVSYVTQTALQRRYPAAPGVFTTGISSISLEDVFVDESRIAECAGREPSATFRVAFAGSFHQMYKGPDTLLEAAALCTRQGLAVEVWLAGDGPLLPRVKALAAELNVAVQAHFPGQLPREEVLALFDRCDVLVMPSRAEGLPRAMLEAMARGCPCIGSNVGGIPELLPPEDLVPPNDARALAAKIMDVARDPERMARMSRQNWKKAQEYRPEVLDARRREFYQTVRLITEEDLNRRARH